MLRRGGILKAFYGYAALLLFYKCLASFESTNGSHPIVGVVLEVAKWR